MEFTGDTVNAFRETSRGFQGRHDLALRKNLAIVLNLKTFETARKEMFGKIVLVLQITLLLPFLDFIKRRLSDVEITLLDDLGHLPIKEGQKQRSNMGTVHVCIGHDHDFVIAKLADIEVIFADPGAEG